MTLQLPYSFYYDVEKRSKYIVAGDTDSLFVTISSIRPSTTELAVEEASKVSKEINNIVTNYFNETLLPKLGVSSEHNQTTFKTELVLEAMLLLESKKNYIMKIVAKEGVVFNYACIKNHKSTKENQPPNKLYWKAEVEFDKSSKPNFISKQHWIKDTEYNCNDLVLNPDIKYVGIPVVRSDYAQFTKDFITELTTSALDRNIERPKLKTYINQIAKKYHDKLQEDIGNYIFDYIGIPVKWGTGYKEGTIPWQITGMKLYNTIIEDAVFSPMSSGLTVPISIPKSNEFEKLIKPIKDKHDRFLGNIPFGNLSKLCIPYNYNNDTVKNAMLKYGIEVNKQEAWEVLYAKAAQRIVEIIKKYSETR